MITLLRSALFNLHFFLASALLSMAGQVLLVVAPKRFPAVPILWARTVLGGARVICGIGYRVRGMELLPQDGPVLLASRHQSAFDTLVWLLLLPRCCYVLKQELLRIPVMGKMVRASRFIAVDRAAGAAAMRHLLRETDRVVANARQIVIFPEGTRAPPGTLLPLQPGVAAIAARAKLPVFPVLTDSGNFWGRRAFRKFPGTIDITILPPIEAGLPRAELMARLEAALRQECPPCG